MEDYMNWNREELIGEIKRLAEENQHFAGNEVSFAKKILDLNNKITRQAENIASLLHLYTSGKRSKSHKMLRKKYRLMKQRIENLRIENDWLKSQFVSKDKKMTVAEKTYSLDEVAQEVGLIDALKDEIAELEEENNRLAEWLHNEWSLVEIATDLGNKRLISLYEIYEDGEKHSTNWCKRKAQEGLGIKNA